MSDYEVLNQLSHDELIDKVQQLEYSVNGAAERIQCVRASLAVSAASWADIDEVREAAYNMASNIAAECHRILREECPA